MFSATRMILNLKAKFGERTIKALAERIGISPVMIRNMEATNNPKISTLEIVANSAGIELDVLVKMGVANNEQTSN